MADKKDKKDKKKEGRMARVRKFFRDTVSEFKKIVWPSRKQVGNNTVVVLVTVLIFAAVIWSLDYALGAGRKYAILKLTEYAEAHPREEEAEELDTGEDETTEDEEDSSGTGA